MLVLQAFVALSLLVTPGESTLSFINPSPAGENEDYSADPVYTEGAAITVSWSGAETGVPLTLAMLQQTIDGDGDASQDVIIDSSVAGLSEYVWTIRTDKNLTASNVFFFDLFSNQSTSPDSTSHYINITSSDQASSTTTATTTTASSASATTSTTSTDSSTALNSASSVTSVTSATASATSPAAVSTSSGLSPNAKVGIGVGVAVPVSLALGALLGWLLYKRRIKRGSAAAASTSTPAQEAPGNYPGSGNPYTGPPSQMGVAPPLGMQQHGQSKYIYGNQQIPAQFNNHGHYQEPSQLEGDEAAAGHTYELS